MANFIKNYLYGKPGQRDFTEAELPANRIQLFKQVLNVRKGSMMGLNFLYLLIWIPAVLWTVVGLGGLLVLNVPTTEELMQILFTWLLILWPLIAITGPFNVGLSYIMHRWARDEHSYTFSDFKIGMKENWKQGLLFGLLDGLVPLVLFVCARFYMTLAGQSTLFLFPLAVSVIAAGLWFLAAPIVPVLIVSYRQGIGGILRNALLMTFAQLPRAIALRLATLAAPIAMLLCFIYYPAASPLIGAVVSTLYLLFLLAFNRLIWASFCNFLGEKYLNPRIEGAATDIGLRPKDLP